MSFITVVDRRRDIALVFSLSAAGSIWFWFHPSSVLFRGPGWFSILLTAILIALTAGMWRASEWSRWGCGLVSVLSSMRLFLMFVSNMVNLNASGTSYGIAPLILTLLLALFWAAIAFYCLRPTTGKLFAQIREARARVSLN